MKWFAPDYYPQFVCVADRCKHSCCIGWEIDIDPDTLTIYRQMPGEWGERLRENITIDGENGSFRLTHDERCPFLNDQGLCELILHFGEESLCQICTDHPRFRNFFETRGEIGLGMCCEEAARIILSKREPVRMILLEDEEDHACECQEEECFLHWRKKLFCCAQDRSLPVVKRVEKMARTEGLTLDRVELPQYKAFLLSLERMDEQWTQELERLSINAVIDLADWEIPFEQLLMYLLMRHLAPAFEDGEKKGRLAFVCFAWLLIRAIFSAQPEQTMERLVETARLFSSEIEYSDENVGRIIDELYRCNIAF